jgi:RepB DNA-primase from phage plasmid
MASFNMGKAVEAQMTAMRSERFEVGLLEIGGNRNGAMRVWKTAQVLQSLNWLKLQNVRGLNINIRPTTNHLSLLDDLTPNQVTLMRATGFEPCVIVETSPGNFQAWLDHGKELAEEDATYAAQCLARKFGADYAAAGRRHFGRLAGFTNRKEKHRQANGYFPYVRLDHAAQGVYSAAQSFAEELAEYKLSVRPAVPYKSYTQPQGLTHTIKTIEEFRVNTSRYPKLHNADLAYAVYAVSHGVAESAIRAAIASRDLAHKGNKRTQQAYIERTLKKAIRDAEPKR